ncbi:MAG TPA: acetyl-CoA carboxylase carboxyltransferase subunit alpha [Candidatus Dorea intestinavium]|nr:acetyl-CoA carboxylase carboxyltransferase subunit alpha [Candidatus Dorea intestinavium]
MQLNNRFKKSNKSFIKRAKVEIPEGIIKKCNKCGAAVLVDEVKANFNICPECQGYFRIHAYRRIKMLADPDTFVEWDQEVSGGNPLCYKGYEEKKVALREKTSLPEGIVTGEIKIQNQKVAIGVMDGRFLMASMGYAVGEKITRLFEKASEENMPVIIFSCSGGARMQEGNVSLMQMAKTAAAIKRHSDKGNLYISVLTDPTTGGVTASFAMLGDIILAEPGALIGFAGPRVIEQTIGQKLPKGFQRSEFLLEHGFIDGIVKREELRETLGKIIRLHRKNTYQEELVVTEEKGVVSNEVASSWDRVLISRMKDRPIGTDYIAQIFEDFLEFHGDRYFGDDAAILGGVASFGETPVTVIAQIKGKDTKDNIKRNFGMPSPEGYRKALRLMKQAEKFKRPIICLVDTPGAFCGLEAEERGQGEAIARNLLEMSTLKVPILSIVIGEGGSGGALAIAVANEVWMLENAIYSILSPEGFASILWKDSQRAQEAAEVMGLSAKDLYELSIIERIVKEPSHLTQENFHKVIEPLKKNIRDFLNRYMKLSEEELCAKRYEKFRKI